MRYSLGGKYIAKLADGSVYEMNLPGTLDENQIGYPDTCSKAWHPDEHSNESLANAGGPIATRFTRKHTYEGICEISREVSFDIPDGKRAFIRVERARLLGLFVDDREIRSCYAPSISTPYYFDITENTSVPLVKGGKHIIKFISDNSYTGLPYDDICYSSAATDETQTNWNGLVGDVSLEIVNETFISYVQVYPVNEISENGIVSSSQTSCVKVRAVISSLQGGEYTLRLHSDAFKEDICEKVSLLKGENVFEYTNVKLVSDIKKWDIDEPNLYTLFATLLENGEEKSFTFGVRSFGSVDGRLAINGRKIFLRSEANCAEFPETGHPPMTIEEWMDILNMYRSYGVNCVRFHSNCPPAAAFFAADKVGILMQPELSNWNPRNAFESDESYAYYDGELCSILRELANHPSFVMLTLGNELHASDKGHERMHALLTKAVCYDDTRLYADASNCHYGHRGCDEQSDFYTACACENYKLRGSGAGMTGFINREYPDALHNFDEAMEYVRSTYKKPVFGFEVGQYEVLPDFNELELFKGISEPANIELIRDKAKKRGMLDKWPEYVKATGELSRLSYKEEVLATIRTKEMSGISLLGLQDFPGQGTALVGMLNSHLKPKSYDFAKPEKFAEFFRDELVLLGLPKFTYSNQEVLRAEVVVANYGKKDIESELTITFTDISSSDKQYTVSLGRVHCPVGENTKLSEINFDLSVFSSNCEIRIDAKVGDICTTYNIWAYNDITPCAKDVFVAEELNEAAIKALEEGKNVFLSLSEAALDKAGAIRANFTTDFWSVGTFPSQSGAMGQLIDYKHPVFKDFPTSYHTDHQWWPMAVGRAIISDLSNGNHPQAIITEMDSYAYMRNMFQLMECRCLSGKLMISTMQLQDNSQYIETRVLTDCIYKYMSSEEFAPANELSLEELKELLEGKNGRD